MLGLEVTTEIEDFPDSDTDENETDEEGEIQETAIEGFWTEGECNGRGNSRLATRFEMAASCI